MFLVRYFYDVCLDFEDHAIDTPRSHERVRIRLFDHLFTSTRGYPLL